jgi:KUP system potassium uptake protein
VVAWTSWPDSRKWVLPLCGVFLVVDLAFLLANGAKLLTGIGAWVPLFIGIAAFTLMRTWRRGRELLRAEIVKRGTQSQTFLQGLALDPPHRVPGTAIFLTPHDGIVPSALLHNLKHNKVLHTRNVFLTVKTATSPNVPPDARLSARTIGEGFHTVQVKYGFMETPDVPQALMASADGGGIVFDPMDTTWFTSRETVEGSRNRGMPLWRDKIFEVMHRNAAPASAYFHIPPERLVELGSLVRI